MSDSWEVVASKKKKKKTPTQTSDVAKQRKLVKKYIGHHLRDDLSCSMDECTQRVNRYRSSLRQTSYFQLFRDQLLSSNLPRLGSIWALGLGSLTGAANAQLQMAMLLEIRDILNGATIPVFLFDPVMTATDRTYCESVSITVLGENRKGRYRLDNGDGENENLLFYMPHCPYRLYCNVIWDSLTNLDRTYIIGNSFQSYMLRRFRQESVSNTDSISLLEGYFTEVSLWPLASKALINSDLSKVNNLEAAFCDTSLMHLNAAKVQSHVDFTTFLSSLQPSDEDIERANAEDEELW